MSASLAVPDRVQRVYRILKQAASVQAPCPSNAALAERLGCGATAVVNAVSLLETSGLITVERRQAKRRIVILENGSSTEALSGSATPHHARKGGPA